MQVSLSLEEFIYMQTKLTKLTNGHGKQKVHHK